MNAGIRNDNNKTEYYALDSTSISTYSQNLSKAEYGHNKDGDKTPQINVLMVVNQLTGEPVYYRTYSGNIPDMSTVKHYLNEMSRLELNNNAVLVADKGYSNIRNIHRFYVTANFLPPRIFNSKLLQYPKAKVI